MKTSIKVLFKSMQKDDKKEILKFEVKGSEDEVAESELFDLSGSIVTLSMEVGGDDVCGLITAEFLSMQRDSKKTVMKYAIKGDSEEAASKLYRFAGRNVELSVSPSQMSIEEFRGEEEDEGLEYSVNGDGTVDMKDENQVTIDEVAAEGKPDWQKELDATAPDNVVNLADKREEKAQGTFFDDDADLDAELE